MTRLLCPSDSAHLAAHLSPAASPLHDEFLGFLCCNDMNAAALDLAKFSNHLRHSCFMCWGHQPNLTRTCLKKSVTHVTPKASLVILWHILAHAKISSFRQTWVRTGRFWYFRERFSFLCLKHDMLAIIQGHNHDIDTTNIFPKTKLHQSLDRKDHHLVLQKESYTYSYVD